MKSIKYKSEQLNCEISIDYVIKNHNNEPVQDAFYFLDGQNAFLDKLATYGRSLRAIDHLDKLHKSYIAIAIHSPNSEKDRINMYSPFILDSNYTDVTNNPKICLKFVSELENIIVPSIQNKYAVKRHHLIGSSLAASLAIYINSISNKFSSMCILSNANFIFDEAMYKHLDLNRKSTGKIYLGVGKSEFSDSKYNPKQYLDAFEKYRNYLKTIAADFYSKKMKFGKHNEKSWEKHFKLYLKQTF